jgi:hypothetical protein
LFGGLLAEMLAAGRQRLGDDHVAGGDSHDEAADPSWDGGRYLGARWAPAHPGRVGRAIRPWAVVVHTTDMRPETFGALVRAWGARPGAGNAAHFVLGRTPDEGLVQVVDVGRNANHAGGQPRHGWFTGAGGELVHPNLVSVGIEVHNAGLLVRDRGQWRTWRRDSGRLVPIGAPIPDADVEPDARHRDRGWHRPTAYQLGELERLLAAIAACSLVRPWPVGWGVRPSGEPPPWAPRVLHYMPIVGHVTLDPARKTDPGPMLSSWLNALG